MLSGKGNDIEVLIRKIPTSQAYLISLFPLCFVLLRSCTALYQSPWQSSLICGYQTLLHFYAHIIGLLDWTVDTSHLGRLSAVEYHITEVNRNSAPVHFDAIC